MFTICSDKFISIGSKLLDVISCDLLAMDTAQNASRGLKEVVVENWKGTVVARFFDGILIEANDSAMEDSALAIEEEIIRDEVLTIMAYEAEPKWDRESFFSEEETERDEAPYAEA